MNWVLVMLSSGCRAGNWMKDLGNNRHLRLSPSLGHRASLAETCPSSLIFLSAHYGPGVVSLNDVIISTDFLPLARLSF